MDKLLELLLNVFTHLSREIQIYILSGFLVISNILLIDYFYYNSTLINFFTSKHLIIISILFAYVIGHFCMGLFYLLIEKTGIEKKINNKDTDVKAKEFIEIYNNNPKAYSYFIERYDTLSNMRWTISSACFINFLIIIPFLLFNTIYWQIIIALFSFLIGSIIFYILTIQTEVELREKTNALLDK